MHHFLSFLVLQHWIAVAWSAVIISENFTSGLNPELLEKDIAGSSANIHIVSSQHLPVENIVSPNMAYHNLSFCEDDLCYRSELKTPVDYRPNIFKANTGKYWISFSFLFSEDTTMYPTISSNQKEVLYIAQLHGGDNIFRSPIASVRVEGDELYLGLCGLNILEDETECSFYSMGKMVAFPDWLDIVIELDMTNESPTGGANVWRNKVQVVNVHDQYVGYSLDTNVPYLKFGLYHIAWKAGLKFTNATFFGGYFAGYKIGDENATFDEMYIGSNVICDVECQPEPIIIPESDGVLSFAEYLDKSWLAALIPVAIVVICVSLFYIANVLSRKRKAATADEIMERMKAENCFTTDSESENINVTHQRETLYTHNLNTLQQGRERTSSVVESIAAALRKTFVWDDEQDFVENSKFTWEEPWVASFRRKWFWYTFGYSSVFLMFVFSIALYGNPVTQEDGLLPWKNIRSWTFWQVGSYLTVTFTLTSIFFVPLYFLPHDFEAGKRWKNDPKFLRRIGVVIPCHKSALEIGNVLKQVMKYIPPQNICVCDNGNFDWPADNTFEVVKAVHPRIQYTFIAQGHKTRALWTGAHRIPKRCKYIMHLDDDTMISDNMVFDESLFKTNDGNHVSAVAFLRCAFKKNRLTRFTDFWYKITDHFHATQATLASRSFVPGPAGLWRRDRFVEIFGIHPALPFGEDIFGGFTTLNQGYAIRSETRCYVTTFAPDVLINCGGLGRTQGYGASSIWKQRAHRWTVSALRITGKSLYSFFTYNTRQGFFSNLMFRLYRFREYKIIFVQVLYVPFCLVILSRGFFLEFICLKFLLFIFPLIRNLWLNYVCWKGQPEMQVTFETVMLSPFYNFFLILCAVHGRLKCLLWYLPNVPPNHGMLQRCRPHPLRTIKELEVDAEAGSTSFSNANPMNGMKMRVGRRDSVSLQDGYFEFFYRDGSSVFITYESGGLTPKHIKAADETRGTLVYRAVHDIDTEAYTQALDCVDGIEGMDSDVSDDDEEHNGDVELSKPDTDKVDSMVESSSLLSSSKNGEDSEVELSSIDSRTVTSKNFYKGRAEESIVTANDCLQI